MTASCFKSQVSEPRCACAWPSYKTQHEIHQMLSCFCDLPRMESKESKGSWQAVLRAVSNCSLVLPTSQQGGPLSFGLQACLMLREPSPVPRSGDLKQTMSYTSQQKGSVTHFLIPHRKGGHPQCDSRSQLNCARHKTDAVWGP